MEDLLAKGAQCTTTHLQGYVEYVTKLARVFLTLNEFYARYCTHHKSEYWPEGQPFHCHLHSCAYWNRDTAAALNFRRMVRSLIATRSIPAPFRRNGSGTPATNDDTPAAGNGSGSDDDDVAAQVQHRYPTRRRTGRDGSDTPAAGNGSGSDDDDVAALAQHRYPTRRRTGRASADNAQQQ
ncbi:hypothetical protein LPJ59_004210 [Coemansia sp. RSA 2399]|nr:hypothetical protein LPJ59_004210 [Coemansia sp. RSA 2399]